MSLYCAHLGVVLIFSGRRGMTLRKPFTATIVVTWSNEANLDWLDANIHQRVATSDTCNDSHFAMQEINNYLSVIQEITKHYILVICYPFLASEERPVNHHPGYLHTCPDDGRYVEQWPRRSSPVVHTTWSSSPNVYMPADETHSGVNLVRDSYLFSGPILVTTS